MDRFSNIWNLVSRFFTNVAMLYANTQDTDSQLSHRLLDFIHNDHNGLRECCRQPSREDGEIQWSVTPTIQQDGNIYASPVGPVLCRVFRLSSTIAGGDNLRFLFSINSDEMTVKAGTLVHLPAGTLHEFKIGESVAKLKIKTAISLFISIKKTLRVT